MDERHITFDDGARSVVDVWGTSGPLVVCVHGITSSRKSWVRLAHALDGRYRVAAYDQRGHGDAAQTHGPMTLARHVDDLREVTASLGDVTALIGHSWGGAVVVLGARSLPVKGAVAVDPMLFVPPHVWRREYLDDAEALLALAPAQREIAVRDGSAWHKLDVEGKVHAVRRMSAEPIARLGQENEVDEGGWDLRGVIRDYPKPLLVLAAGPEDSVMSQADRALLAEAGGSHVKVVDFKTEGHNLHRTAFDAFAAEVAAFLESLR
jgi:pimeloyl-ACP methyl ester carboxylesterase